MKDWKQPSLPEAVLGNGAHDAQVSGSKIRDAGIYRRA